MTRMNVVKLTATGLRTLIREEATRARRRRRVVEEHTPEAHITPEIEEAVEELVGLILDQIFDEDDLEGHDGAHPEVHNDVIACVEKIFDEYGDGGEDDEAGEYDIPHTRGHRGEDFARGT